MDNLRTLAGKTFQIYLANNDSPIPKIANYVDDENSSFVFWFFASKWDWELEVKYTS